MEFNEENPNGKSRTQAVISYLWPFLLLFIHPDIWYIAFGSGIVAVLLFAALSKRDQFSRFHSLQAAVWQIASATILTLTYYGTISAMRQDAEQAKAMHLNGTAVGVVPMIFGFTVMFALVSVFGLILLYLAVRAAKGHWPKLHKTIQNW